MIAKNKIKSIVADKGIRMSELAERVGMTPEVFSVKISRGVTKIADFENILDKLDCELVVVDRKTKKVY